MATSSSEAPGLARELPVRPDSEVARATHALAISPEEMELFAQASHDRNPLHCSANYARQTAFGEPVVFGVLGALAAAARLRERPHQSVERIRLEFRDAIQVGVDYQVELEESADRARLKLNDGRRTLLHLEAQFRDEPVAPLAAMRRAGSLRSEAAARDLGELSAGLAVSGSYGPDGPAFAALMYRYRLDRKGFGVSEVAALCLASYLVGMELPGERALFSRLTVENLRGGVPRLDFHATVRTFDERVDLLKTTVELTGDRRPVGTMTLESFVRRDLPPPLPFPRSERWQGKTALVIGGSRGLGAAISQALAAQGCTVLVNYFRSRERVEALQRAVGEGAGSIIPVEGDAADRQACERARQALVDRGQPLDLLVCSAFPLARTLWIDGASIDRISQYIADSVRLVGTPMATFLPLLAQRGGQLAIISSAWVTSAPADWPHYVGAKYAIEGLAQVAAREYKSVRFLLARPPRLLTDLTNTPLGRQRTIPAEQAATAIVARLGEARPPGAVDLLDEPGWASGSREGQA